MRTSRTSNDEEFYSYRNKTNYANVKVAEAKSLQASAQYHVLNIKKHVSPGLGRNLFFLRRYPPGTRSGPKERKDDTIFNINVTAILYFTIDQLACRRSRHIVAGIIKYGRFFLFFPQGGIHRRVRGRTNGHFANE